jgi:chorismate synthase
LAKQALKQLGISITAYTSQVGDIKLEKNYKDYDFNLIESNDVRCPDAEKAQEMAELITQVKAE